MAFTKEQQKMHETLVEYDAARKAEGYAIAYRRFVTYRNIVDELIDSGPGFGKHVETMYLNRDNGKALLVKVQPDGAVSAFEAVS